jgi:hypothetical protein
MTTLTTCARCKRELVAVGFVAVCVCGAVLHGATSCNEVQRRVPSDTFCQRIVAEPVHGQHKEPRGPSPANTFVTYLGSASSTSSLDSGFIDFPIKRF